MGKATISDHRAAMVDRALLRLSDSQCTRSVATYATEAGASSDEVELLVAISLVERSARPIDARALEWLVAIPLRAGLLGARLRRRAERISVGPFQIRGAPFRLRDCVYQALCLVRENNLTSISLDEVAAIWNGPFADHSGPIPYTVALELALRHTRKPRALSRER